MINDNERMIMNRTIKVAIVTAVTAPWLVFFASPDANARPVKDLESCGDTVSAILDCKEPAPRFPACRNEDGSGQRPTCVWDERHMGNGEGRSYKAITRKGQDDRIKYIPHRRAHRLLAL